MRIAYLLGSLNRGGTETLLLDVFRNAGKNGLKAIGFYRKSGVLETDFIDSGIPMYKVPVGNPLHYILKLRKFLRGNHIQIVHAQQPMDALYAWLACLGAGVRVILTFHGYDFNEGKLGRWILRLIIKRTDRNIFVSDTQRKYYQQRYKLRPENQKVVYNGVSFDKLEIPDSGCTNFNRTANNVTSPPKIASISLKDELQLSSGTLLLGTVGNFVPGRDPLTICRFLNLLNQQGLDFQFVFIGKRTVSAPQLYDDCVSYCEEHALHDKVSFLGSRNDVPSILHQLDAFLFASDHDTFGIAVVEAMAVAIPVFVNDWEVMTEITDDGNYATLYKTKDENDLLREFMLFLQNKAVFKVKAMKAALFVREKYSIEKHIEELQKVYSK